jgi:hypothetical protein
MRSSSVFLASVKEPNTKLVLGMDEIEISYPL